MDKKRRTHFIASTLARFRVATKRNFTIALWMPVRLSETTPASLNGYGGP
jgi:hypothetical protein